MTNQPVCTYVIRLTNTLGDTGSEHCYGTLAEAVALATKITAEDPSWSYKIADINGNVVA